MSHSSETRTAVRQQMRQSRREQCDRCVSATTASHALMHDSTPTTRQRRGRGCSVFSESIGQQNLASPRRGLYFDVECRTAVRQQMRLSRRQQYERCVNAAVLCKQDLVQLHTVTQRRLRSRGVFEITHNCTIESTCSRITTM